MDSLVVLQRPIKQSPPVVESPSARGGANTESTPIQEFRPKISFVKLYHAACEHNRKCGDGRGRQGRAASAELGGKLADRFVQGNMFSESADSVLKAYLPQGGCGGQGGGTHILTAELVADITYDEDKLD